MSHQALQRLVVRLLYDPELVARVYADPEPALAGLELTPAERQFVVALDRRAYGTDPHRRSRSLTDLLREFPAAASLVAREPGGLATLDGFFSSPSFHRAIAARGSLARAFGDYLLVLAEDPKQDPRLARFARLEQAIALVRRAPLAPPTPRAGAVDWWLITSPHVALVELPAGTLDEHSAVMAALTRAGADPVAAIAGDRLALPAAHPAKEAAEPLLIERSAAAPGAEPEVQIAPVTLELAQLLEAAAPPGASAATLQALARRLGAEPGEDAELLADLTRQGLLTPSPAPSAIRHAAC